MIVVQRPPRTDDELWEFVATFLGVEIPRVRVCKNHCAPFEAFADAFFARTSMSVWKASRAFGGKSFLLSALVMTEAICLAAEVALLGGSGEQARRVLEYMSRFWAASHAPRHLLASDPSRQRTYLVNGAKVYALMASQRSVRGPHPNRLRLDEVDEMAPAIFNAALGQTIDTPYLAAQTVMSSTHHNPRGTMKLVLERAVEDGWPVYEWCYRETLQPHGWLPRSAVEKKQSEVGRSAWKIEFELERPAPDNPAFDRAALVKAFGNRETAVATATRGQLVIFEQPIAGGKYAHGVDWGRRMHRAVHLTVRNDVRPYKTTAFSWVNKRSWPEIVKPVNERIVAYNKPGMVTQVGAHDQTGMGDVVEALLSNEARRVLKGVQMTGGDRNDMISEYVKAVENGEYLLPPVEPFMSDHFDAEWEDLYGNGHLPDTVAAGVLLNWALRRFVPPHPPRAVGVRVPLHKEL